MRICCRPRGSARAGGVLLAALCVAASSVAAPAAAQQISVQAGVSIAPDTVRIGDPFRVTIGVRAPAGATIEFPRALDSTGTVQSLDPVAIRTPANPSAVEQYADYRVAAWDVGSQPILIDTVVVRLNGAVRRITLTNEKVFVKSLLPQDTTLRVPKPPRPLFGSVALPWWIWALLAAAIIAIGLLLWWWWRRRRQPPPVVVVDPYERAVAEFTRIDELRLLEAGERGRYVILVIEVLRDYLAARYAQAALSLTSTELTRTARHLPHLPHEQLTRLLTDADLIKFARRPVSTERARDIGREARAIVDAEHAASQPPPVQEAAA